MRMSCNGCRVLRKGCSEDCSLRPCLQWLKSPESQANATLFLAKFYGRSGLLNLVNAGPTHLRPAIFRSLLYEACGRVINPVYGSVGLICSGKWDQCREAVESLLRCGPPSGSNDSFQQQHIIPLQGYDIRHVSKDSAATFHRVRNRTRFKRSLERNRVDSVAAELMMSDSESKFTVTGWHHSEDHKYSCDGSLDSFSVEPASVNRYERTIGGMKPVTRPNEIELELTLALNPVVEISDSES